jgi:hypothetical protein
VFLEQLGSHGDILADECVCHTTDARADRGPLVIPGGLEANDSFVGRSPLPELKEMTWHILSTV